MIAYKDFEAAVLGLAMPQGRARNLSSVFSNWVKNGLIKAQMHVRCLKDKNINYYAKPDVIENCGISRITHPRGEIQAVYAIKPGLGCVKLFYEHVAASDISRTVAENANCGQFKQGDAWQCDVRGYDYCYPPFLAQQPEDDVWFKGARRTFAVNPNGQLVLCPRFPCGYIIVVHWMGTKRLWGPFDLVCEDEDLKLAVSKFVQSNRLTEHEQNPQDGQVAMSGFNDILGDMMIRCRRETEERDEAFWLSAFEGVTTWFDAVSALPAPYDLCDLAGSSTTTSTTTSTSPCSTVNVTAWSLIDISSDECGGPGVFSPDGNVVDYHWQMTCDFGPIPQQIQRIEVVLPNGTLWSTSQPNIPPLVVFHGNIKVNNAYVSPLGSFQGITVLDIFGSPPGNMATKDFSFKLRLILSNGCTIEKSAANHVGSNPGITTTTTTTSTTTTTTSTVPPSTAQDYNVWCATLSPDGTYNRFGRLNLLTGTFVQITAGNGAQYYHGLALDRRQNILYASKRTVSDCRLIKLDQTDGSEIDIGSFGGGTNIMRDLIMPTTGAMLAEGGGSSNLYSIDVSSAAKTLINPFVQPFVGVSPTTGAIVISDDELDLCYYIDLNNNGRLYSFNKSSAATTDIGHISVIGYGQGCYGGVIVNGLIYVVIGNAIYQINPTIVNAGVVQTTFIAPYNQAQSGIVQAMTKFQYDAAKEPSSTTPQTGTTLLNFTNIAVGSLNGGCVIRRHDNVSPKWFEVLSFNVVGGTAQVPQFVPDGGAHTLHAGSLNAVFSKDTGVANITLHLPLN